MLKKALAGAVGLAALWTGVAIILVAAALALFFALEPSIGRAGGAAVVALIFAVILGLMLALVMARAGGPKEPEHHDGGMVETLLGMAKERPILSVAAAIAATVIVFRNPALVATIAAAFLDRSKGPK